MKTKTSYPIIRLMAAVILVLTSFSVVSCSKDDEDGDPSKLIGMWELTWKDGVSTESYYFDKEGWGDYYSPSKGGSFYYTVESPGSIHFRMIYREFYGSGSYKDEFIWPYSIKGDKLILNGKTYTLKYRERDVIYIDYSNMN